MTTVRVATPQPFVTVSVTVSLPVLLFALYVAERDPFPVPLDGMKVFPIELARLHESPFAIVKLSVAVSPRLIVLATAVNELIVTSGFTVTTTGSLRSVHRAAFVTRTVYEPETPTATFGVVAPSGEPSLYHTYEDMPAGP